MNSTSSSPHSLQAQVSLSPYAPVVTPGHRASLLPLDCVNLRTFSGSFPQGIFSTPQLALSFPFVPFLVSLQEVSLILVYPFLVTSFNDPLSSQTQYFIPPSIPLEDILRYYYRLFVYFIYYLSIFFPYERRRNYKFCSKVSIWKKVSSKCGVCGINRCMNSNYTHVCLHWRWNTAVFLEWQAQQDWLAIFQVPP